MTPQAQSFEDIWKDPAGDCVPGVVVTHRAVIIRGGVVDCERCGRSIDEHHKPVLAPFIPFAEAPL